MRTRSPSHAPPMFPSRSGGAFLTSWHSIQASAYSNLSMHLCPATAAVHGPVPLYLASFSVCHLSSSTARMPVCSRYRVRAMCGRGPCLRRTQTSLLCGIFASRSSILTLASRAVAVDRLLLHANTNATTARRGLHQCTGPSGGCRSAWRSSLRARIYLSVSHGTASGKAALAPTSRLYPPRSFQHFTAPPLCQVAPVGVLKTRPE